jgi:hypothetical protein
VIVASIRNSQRASTPNTSSLTAWGSSLACSTAPRCTPRHASLRRSACRRSPACQSGIVTVASTKYRLAPDPSEKSKFPASSPNKYTVATSASYRLHSTDPPSLDKWKRSNQRFGSISEVQWS